MSGKFLTRLKQLSQAGCVLKPSKNTPSQFRVLRRPAWACPDRIPVRKMYAELSASAGSAEPLTFQGLSENSAFPLP
jgi:hypothetical protein